MLPQSVQPPPEFFAPRSMPRRSSQSSPGNMIDFGPTRILNAIELHDLLVHYQDLLSRGYREQSVLAIAKDLVLAKYPSIQPARVASTIAAAGDRLPPGECFHDPNNMGLPAAVPTDLLPLLLRILLPIADIGTGSPRGHDFDISWLQFGEKISECRYGPIYRAKWCGASVAVIPIRTTTVSHDAEAQVRADVARLAGLRYHNMVLTIGACLRQPNICIVTELVSVLSLPAFLQNRRKEKMNSKLFIKIARQVAQGMDYLHHLSPPVMGLVFCNHNILIHPTAHHVFIAHFGLSNVEGEAVRMQPKFVAPEVFRTRISDRSADVFLFALIVYELLTQKPPFESANPTEAQLSLLKGTRPTLPQATPPRVRSLIERCWHDGPAQRPSFSHIISELDMI